MLEGPTEGKEMVGRMFSREEEKEKWEEIVRHGLVLKEMKWPNGRSAILE